MNNPACLSFVEAKRIADAAVESLLATGQKANICVVNVYKRPLVKFSMDETRESTGTIATKKARLSAHTGRRTRYLRDEFKKPDGDLTPALFGIKKEDEVPYAGGVPIYFEVFQGKSILLGAIGISELSENDDEQHAVNAVENCGYLSDRF